MKDLSSDCSLLMLDISSLYANILHDKGIGACKLALEQRRPRPPPAFLLKMIEHMLAMDNFKPLWENLRNI